MTALLRHLAGLAAQPARAGANLAPRRAASGRRGGGARLTRLALLTALLLPTSVRGDDGASLPSGVQAELIAKIAAYDRNLRTRAGAEVLVLIVHKRGNALSRRLASQLKHELGDIPDIAGLPQRSWSIRFSGAAELARTIRASKAAILYLSTGLRAELPAIVEALDGVDILSVAAKPSYVPLGIGAGFDLVAGRPKLLCNLTHARKQNVDFKAELLRLMRVYE